MNGIGQFLMYKNVYFVTIELKKGSSQRVLNACPQEATIFGERSELLKIAHKRIKENPGKYINKVWGEHEVGGTSVLYLSDIDLGFLSYPVNLGNKPLPERTSTAMESVPFAFVGMGGVMLGLNWIIRRRMEFSKEQNEPNRFINKKGICR